MTHKMPPTIRHTSDRGVIEVSTVGLRQLRKRDRAIEYMRRCGAGVCVNLHDLAYACEITTQEARAGLLDHDDEVEIIIRGRSPDTDILCRAREVAND